MATDQTTLGVTAQRPSFSAWIGVVLLFLIFAFFVFVAIGAGARGSALDKKRVQNRLDKLKASRSEAMKALYSYAWIDKNKKTVRIPITDAMHIMYTELQKPPAPAGPIPPEAQVGGTQTTAPVTAPPAASPAPSVSPSATPASKGGHEPEAGKATTLNPAPVAPGTQPGGSATPAAPAPPPSGQPNPGGPPQSQATATPRGSALPVPGKTP